MKGASVPDARRSLGTAGDDKFDAEQMKLEWLKPEVQMGIDELERGEYVDG